MKTPTPFILYGSLVLILTLWLGLPAHAQRIGVGNEDVFISSEAFEGVNNRGTWTGNVRIIQGKAILVADKVTGDIDENGDIKSITATGNVRYSDGEQAITGKKGVYNDKARTMTITDDVVVTQGENVFTAGKATYWLDTGKFVFTPEAGKRVRGIFYTSSDVSLNN